MLFLTHLLLADSFKFLKTVVLKYSLGFRSNVIRHRAQGPVFCMLPGVAASKDEELIMGKRKLKMLIKWIVQEYLDKLSKLLTVLWVLVGPLLMKPAP